MKNKISLTATPISYQFFLCKMLTYADNFIPSPISSPVSHSFWVKTRSVSNEEKTQTLDREGIEVMIAITQINNKGNQSGKFHAKTKVICSIYLLTFICARVSISPLGPLRHSTKQKQTDSPIADVMWKLHTYKHIYTTKLTGHLHTSVSHAHPHNNTEAIVIISGPTRDWVILHVGPGLADCVYALQI